MSALEASVIKLCVLGPTGRMGSQVCELAHVSAAFKLHSAVQRTVTTPSTIAPYTDVEIGSSPASAFADADVYIDFTTPEATALAATAAVEFKRAAVVGTTGLDERAQLALDQLAQVAPVFVAANFSPGVSLLLHLAEKAAAALGSDYDLEIVEMHHRNKVDAPSGTAVALGEALAAGRGLDLATARQSVRDGQVGPRTRDEIGMVAVRGGDIVGEHTALFVGSEERLEITHRAQKRSVFASGALTAAQWIVEQPPGRYSMSDMLGF